MISGVEHKAYQNNIEDTNNPAVNETNYNVHLKKNNGIVNINLLNNSTDGWMFGSKLPKTQGLINIEEDSTMPLGDMKKTYHSTSYKWNNFKVNRKPNHQASITLTSQAKRK